MELTYEELLAAQLRFGTTKEDIIKQDDFFMLFPNVVIAPWWGVEMFNNSDLKITEVNEKVFNLMNEDVEFSFIQIKQAGAPAIIEEVLSLGVTNCKNLIFVGSVGSLSEDINIGDVVIPKSSICGDGASRYLNSDLKDDFGKKENPDTELMNLLLKATQIIGNNTEISAHNVDNFSVDTIFGQFPHIDKIKNMGAEVIEMETYSLFKSSRISGIKAVALLCVSDNTVVNKSLYSGRTKEDKKRRKMVRDEIIPKIIINCLKDI